MSNIVDKGRYVGKCEKWGFVGFKSKKDSSVLKFFAADFKITTEGPFAGTYVSLRSSTKDGGREFTAKIMEAMGWERGTEPREYKLDAEVELTIDHEEAKDSNGETVFDGDGNKVMRAFVKYVNPIGGGVVDRFKMSKSEEDDFVKEFMATTKTPTRVDRKSPASSGRPREAPMTGGPVGNASNDELPF